MCMGIVRVAHCGLLLAGAALAGMALAASAPAAASAPTREPAPVYDVIIAHGRVVDGTGAPWYAADVGVRAGRIAAIGRLDGAAAKQRIDAAGRIVAPGFIDMLGQSELTVLVDPHVPSKVFQGITTEITGEGNSVAPVNKAIAKENAARYQLYGIKRDWADLAGYFARLERQGIGINLASYVGATTVRPSGYRARSSTHPPRTRARRS
jgi:N-acyl-D-amino-acid deacylase